MTSLRCQKRPNRKLNFKKSANLFYKKRKYKLSWTVYSERGSSLEGSWVGGGGGGWEKKTLASLLED